MTKLEETQLNNVRLYEGDGSDILQALPDASLGRFFLLFPDPWPKTRHHKRRFLQMEMLDELARVPYGELTTYGALAAKAGRPRAARAVGTVMNRNPVPIVLPCHRVVGSTGALTGYAGGLDRKRALLELEGAL